MALPLAVVMFFGLAALPEAPRFSELEVAPDFALLDHRGQTVSLHGALEAGPLLMVFYRGFW